MNITRSPYPPVAGKIRLGEAMKGKIYYEKSPPATLFENRYYNVFSPYSISSKALPERDVADSHFSTCIELFMCKNATGMMTIQGKNWMLSGNHAFIIPPFVMHSVVLEPGEGKALVLQVSIEAYMPYIDLARLMHGSQRALIPREIEQSLFGYLYQQLKQIIKNNSDFMLCTNLILDILMRISSDQPSTEGEDSLNIQKDVSDKIKAVVLWSMSHISQPVELKKIAEVIGYTKSYFCTWFKKKTGSSYIEYINKLKIDYACEVLRKTESLENACDSIGLDNVSYFIQLFKKVNGLTPKQFLKRQQNPIN